jgi:hypothetical protein
MEDSTHAQLRSNISANSASRWRARFRRYRRGSGSHGEGCLLAVPGSIRDQPAHSDWSTYTLVSAVSVGAQGREPLLSSLTNGPLGGPRGDPYGISFSTSRTYRVTGSGYILVLLVSLLVLQGPLYAQEPDRTPRAGEEYRTTLFGRTVVAPWLVCTNVNAFTLGSNWIPDGPRNPLVLPFGGALVVRDDMSTLAGDLYQPFGSLYFWRNGDQGAKRVRAGVSRLYNEVRYNKRLASIGGWEFVGTFENLTIRFGRPEYVEEQRLDNVDIEWQYVRAGVGLGYRKSIAPCDVGLSGPSTI